MSIVNISSENLKSGNDSEYTIKLDKPLMRAIGVQILNVTIPLSYNIFNQDGNIFTITDIVDIDGSASPDITAQIPWGTYSGDDLAFVTTVAMQQSDALVLEEQKMINKKQHTYHTTLNGLINNVADFISIQKEAVNRIIEVPGTGSASYSYFTAISQKDVEPGFAVVSTKTTPYVYRRVAAVGTPPQWFRYSSSSSGNLTALNWDNNNLTNWNNNFDSIVNKGFIMAYDEEQQVFILSHPTHQSWKIKSTNTRRVLKTYGYTADQVSVQRNVAFNGVNFNGTTWKIRGPYNWPHTIISSQSPELTGPSIIFMRLGGDMLLDQQNTETHFHDRIPIPLDQPHGSVVHFEKDDTTDVIPFSVPCDISTIKIRFEYGDDNTIVGGETDNFRGHHTYLRLKFYFAHENL